MAIARIEVTGPDRYELNDRGKHMVLERSAKGWTMTTTSAVTRAYSMGGASVREFNNLHQVEDHYKSWRGLCALLAEVPAVRH